MKITYLKEQEVEHLVSVAEAIELLEAAFRDQAGGKAWTNPRNRLRFPGGTLQMMASAVPGYFGYKAYSVGAGKTQFLFFLYSTDTMQLAAMIEADRLGQIRTGAASGLATRFLSDPTAREATMFGAGWQAQSQLVAIDAVRKLERVWIVNRNADRRKAFIEKMQPLVKARLEPAPSAAEAVRSSQIVTTITTSREPVLKGEWLQPGTHINAAGANMLLRREVDDEVISRSNRIIVDSVEQCRIESGEFLAAIETGRRHWEDFIELRNVVAGVIPGRVSASDITLFESGGVALEDVAVGKFVYERARERGVGRVLEL